MPDPYTTAEQFKARGIGRQESWSRWVQATSLRPGMDAKDWYAIYDSVEAALPEEPKPVQITSTHYDNLRKCEVEIQEDRYGVFIMRWADGGTGSNPPCYPPVAPRFVALDDPTISIADEGGNNYVPTAADIREEEAAWMEAYATEEEWDAFAGGQE